MVTVTSKSGKQVVLLNPAERARKFAGELRIDAKVTNDLKNVKQDGLTPTERAFRAGYLSARKDSANAYKSNQKKRGK